MASNQNLLHHGRQDIFESPRTYKFNESDFVEQLRSHLPGDWKSRREEIWLHCFGPQCRPIPQQGWKIHVSSSVDDASSILEQVALSAAQHETHFKCAQDRRTLGFLNSKLWSRGGFGKFITLYPPDQESFLVLLKELADKLRDFDGPYILSDRQHPNARVVFYRYGGMISHQKLRLDGSFINVIETPSGELVEDVRTPYYDIPSWVTDPFPEDQELDSDEDAPLHGRFQPTEAFHFTSAGGTYLATDLFDSSVIVLKESRSNVVSAPNCAATTSLLKHEYEILRTIEKWGIGPKPIALFEEGGHTFLAESLIAGESLRSPHGLNPLIVSRPGDLVYAQYGRFLQTVFEGLVDKVSQLHALGIVHGDISPNNVIVHDETGNVQLIDFEASWIPDIQDIQEKTKTATAGFSLPNALRDAASPFLNDLFGVAAVMCHCMFPVMAIFEIIPQNRASWVRQVVLDLRLPVSVADLLIELFNCKRTSVTQEDVRQAFAGELLRSTGVSPHQILRSRGTAVEGGPRKAVFFRPECDDVANAVAAYIAHEMDLAREDTVVPSDSNLFSTNPVSVAYGSAGVAWCLHQLAPEASPAVLEWTTAHLASERLPPGLLMGKAGVAVVLAVCGRHESAKTLLDAALSSDLLFDAFGLFHGCAGVGVACLYVYELTHADDYIHAAIQIGERILSSAVRSGPDLHWSTDTADALGLGHGNAGIALFLLYLYAKTKQSHFLETGREALRRDLEAFVEEPNGAISYPRNTEEPSPAYPYVEWGSAGIGQVVARYWSVTGDVVYSKWLDRLLASVDRKYSVAVGLNLGMSGIGAFLLDVARFAPSFDVDAQLNTTIDAVLRLQMPREVGTAFPIGATFRISCGLANGSGGVALFLRACNQREISLQLWPDSILYSLLQENTAFTHLITN
jgi:serine/threonine protein kinase